MNTYNNNYLTYVEPPVPKNAFLYKKTPTNISKIFNNNKKYLNDTSINVNQLKARASRYLLDKKYRGELDISSPGNKNILIDTDSELTANSKNTDNKNKGCTKLVIEKIESQKPQINKEYYKFTNQPKTIVHDLNENQDIFFTKKNYVTQNVSRCNSILRNTNKIINKNYSNSNFNNFSLQQGFDYNNYSTLNNYNDFGYNSPMKKTYTRSTNNIFKSNNKFKQQLSNIKQAKEQNKNNSGFILKERNSSINYGNHYDIYPKEYDYEDNKERMFDTINISRKPDNMKYYKIKKTNINNNYPRGNKDININPQENTLYENYQDLIKLNTFNRISQYNNTHRNINNGTMKYSKINIYPDIIQKAIKIQSAWRGTYVRILMGFYWNLSGFKNTLDNIFKNHISVYFSYFLKNLSHYKSSIKHKRKYNNNNNYEKSIDEYANELKQKEEDYDNLLKNYNSLVERCTELQHLVNKNKSEEKKSRWTSSYKKRENDDKINPKLLDIERNKINFNENTNKDDHHSWKKLKIENHNVNLEIVISRKIFDIENDINHSNKFDTKKQFDIIEVEQKDKFNLITPKKLQKEIIIKPEQEQNHEQEKIDDSNNLNLRARYKRKKKESNFNYLDNFTSNLSITNTEQLLLEEIPKKKENIPFKISKLEITLLNKNELKEIEPIKNQKIFEIENIKKIKNDEISIKGIKKEIKNEKSIYVKREYKNKITNRVKKESKNEKIKNGEFSILGIKKEYKNEKIKNGEFSILGIKKEFKNEKINNGDLVILGIKKEYKNEKINNGELSILGNKKVLNNVVIKNDVLSISGIKKEQDFKKIKNEDISIFGNKNEFKNEKMKNDEIPISEKRKEPENKTPNINLIKESQNSLSIEIKGRHKKPIDNTNIIEKNINILLASTNKIKNEQTNEAPEEKLNTFEKKQEIKAILFEQEKLEKINDNEIIILGIKKANKKPKKLKKKKDKKRTKEDEENIENKEIEESKENEEIIKKENNLDDEVQINTYPEITGQNSPNHRAFDDLIFIDNNNSICIKNNTHKLKQKQKPENILENVEQIFFEGIYNINNNYKINNQNKGLIIENENNIIRNEKDTVKDEVKKIEFIPDYLNINIFIKSKKKKRCEKMTEITEELNPILPCNNYELSIDRIIRKILYINNNEQELSFIKKNEDGKNKIIYNNINLEIYKDDALEINPLMMKQSLITKENDINIPFNKYTFFTKKAKNNMMKMILPIRLKTTLREFVQRNTFPLLIKYLKDIAKLKQK